MTLLANRPGVRAGVAMLTLTLSKRGLLKVSRNWVGRRGVRIPEGVEEG